MAKFALGVDGQDKSPAADLAGTDCSQGLAWNLCSPGVPYLISIL